LTPKDDADSVNWVMMVLNPMNQRVSIDPQICHGKPVVCGTRVLLSTILGALAGGDSVEQIQEDYKVTQEDISAALEFARDASEYQTFSYNAVA
jgi:uncharacterized protein (DUF433 family)